MSMSTSQLVNSSTIRISNPSSNRSSNRSSRGSRARHKEVTRPARVDPRTLTRCHVCGFAEIRTDEVLDPEVLFLAECPRCENRWTSRQPIGRAVPIATVAGLFERVPARIARAVAPAA